MIRQRSWDQTGAASTRAYFDPRGRPGSALRLTSSHPTAPGQPPLAQISASVDSSAEQRCQVCWPLSPSRGRLGRCPSSPCMALPSSRRQSRLARHRRARLAPPTVV
eukprot:508629-Prymnesium_polylepis.1